MWKWSGGGQRNKVSAAISRGAKRSVWTCKTCGRGQQGGRHDIGEPRRPHLIKVCRYCKAEHELGKE